MQKKFFNLAIVFFALSFSAFSYAQSPKLGVVNVALVLEQAPQAKLATASLEKEFSPQQNELKGLAAKLEGVQKRVPTEPLNYERYSKNCKRKRNNDVNA